jgi:hypothetical protein
LHFAGADCIAHRFTDALTDAPPDQIADGVTDFSTHPAPLQRRDAWL